MKWRNLTHCTQAQALPCFATNRAACLVGDVVFGFAVSVVKIDIVMHLRFTRCVYDDTVAALRLCYVLLGEELPAVAMGSVIGRGMR